MILVTSRRPERVATAVTNAEATGHPVLVVTHGFRYPRTDIYMPREAPYADVVNAGIVGAMVKWDDDNEYPPDHADILKQYRGKPMFGRVKVRDCQTGRIVGSTVSICAGVIDRPVTADSSGRIGNSFPQSHVVKTGVVKLRCGDWSWNDPSPWRCDHYSE